MAKISLKRGDELRNQIFLELLTSKRSSYYTKKYPVSFRTENILVSPIKAFIDTSPSKRLVFQSGEL